MSLKIVTDSACDLPATLLTEYDITVVPLYINIGEQSYLAGLELTSETFYSDLSDYNPYPTTAAPGVAVFKQTYQTLTTEGATEILSIHVASSLSTTYHTAQMAAQEIDTVKVTIFDSQQVSMGIGFLVLTAAKAAIVGQSVTEIVAALQEQVTRTHLLGVLATLDSLRRSGRASVVMAGLGTLLQIKPVFKLYQGQVSLERVRTRKRAITRLVALVDGLSPWEHVALLHTRAPHKAAELQEKIQYLLPPQDVLIVEVTPILGTHFGLGGVGVIGVRQR